MVKRANNKRSTPSIYKKKKVRVRGFVDRISNGIVVVVIKDPNDTDCVKEIYVPVGKFPYGAPEIGEKISVLVEMGG